MKLDRKTVAALLQKPRRVSGTKLIQKTIMLSASYLK